MTKNNTDFFEKKKSWSEIKDRLLSSYLKPYFQKILFTGRPTIYIDCFAGKGKFDDDNFGSPLIALEKGIECKQNSQLKCGNDSLSMYFIEPNHFQDLEKNILDYKDACDKDFPTNVISGTFEDSIMPILEKNSNFNLFLYIDPYGIKALNSTLFSAMHSLNLNSFEMLINFNSFGFFRDACRVLSVNYTNDEALQDLSDLV